MAKLKSIRSKLVGLTITMFVVVILTSGVGGFILYQTSISETAQSLTEIAKSNAHMIEAVAAFNKQHSEKMHSGTSSFDNSLRQIRTAHEQFRFGNSGEFILARKEGNQIVFLMQNHLAGSDVPKPVTFDNSDRAEPMHKALAGDSGWVIGHDYRDVLVMAAYEPIKSLNLGLVAKIDMQEIRAPFIKAGIIIIVIALLISFAALQFFSKTIRQVSDRFEDNSQQFIRMAANATDLIYRMSMPEGRYEYVNPASTRMLGITPEELYQSPKKIQDLIHPDWRPYFKEQWQKLLAGDMPPTYEYQIVTPAGEVKWISQRNFLLTNDNGKPVAIEGIATDITMHMEHANELLLEKEIAQRYLDIAGSIMMALNEKGDITLFNRKACEVLGWSEQEALGKNWFENFLPLAEKEKVMGVFNQAILGNLESLEFFENPILTRDGDKRIIEWHNSILLDKDGKSVIGLLSSGQDITERKQAEKNRIESELFAQATIDASSANICVLNKAGDILSVNHAWRIFYDENFISTKMPDYFIGSNYFQICRTSEGINADEAEPLLEGALQVIRGELDEFSLQYPCHSPTQQRWYNARVTRFQNESGNIMLSHEDITKLKLFEEQLKLSASVFSHAREAITITDSAGIIIDVNKTFTDITGFSREEVIGQNPRVLTSGRQSAEFYEGMWNELIKNGYWSGEIWNRRKSGEVYAELLNISSVYDEEGVVKNYVALFTDITNIKDHQRQLEHIAHYDVLTNLPNRTLLADRLSQTMLQCKRHHLSMALVFLDLDGFKAVNDAHGHAVGDELLIALSKRMKESLREEDTLARIGGDEFVAVLADLVKVEDCEPMLERLLQAASERVVIGDLVLHVTASLGVALYSQDNVDADLLMRHSDQAMYRAKLEGKNRYYIFDTELHNSFLKDQEFQTRIEKGIEDNEFELFLQPKVYLGSGKIQGLEALVRWRHPEKGLLLPGAFLPSIKKSSLEMKFGDWVFKSVFQILRQLKQYDEEIPVSINITAKYLQQQNFTTLVKSFFKENINIKPGDLKLEIVESSLLEDLDDAKKKIDELQLFGVEFSLDDFGTGYSSLTYLRNLPFKELKIDQTFVKNVLDHPEDLPILTGSIGLANAFGISVVAEGVETEAHGRILQQLGCKIGQGYAIAKPMPFENIKDWLKEWQVPEKWKGYSAVSMENMPAVVAGIQHRAWLKNIKSFIQTGTTNYPAQLDHSKCDFGLWLNEAGRKQFGLEKNYQLIVKIHQEIHDTVDLLLKSETLTDHDSSSLLKSLYSESEQMLYDLEKLIDSHNNNYHSATLVKWKLP